MTRRAHDRRLAPVTSARPMTSPTPATRPSRHHVRDRVRAHVPVQGRRRDPALTRWLLPPASDPHQFGRVDDDGTVWLISSAGERIVGSWQAGDREAAFAHFGRRFDDLSTEVTLMEERLAAGTGDARKIKANAAALAETLPTASVLGDIDALAGRLSDPAGARRRHGRRRSLPARRAPGRPDRPQRGVGRRGRGGGRQLDALEGCRRPDARDPRRMENHHRSGPQGRRRAVEALFRGTGNLQPAAGFPLRRAGPRARGCAAVQGTAVRAGRGDVRFDGLGRHQRRIPQAVDRMERRRGAPRKEVDDALWRRFKAAQDAFFTARNAAQQRKRTRSCRPMPAPKRRCWPKPRRSTPAITTPPERRCDRSPTNGTRSAKCPGSGPPTWSGGCAQSRRRCATPAKRIGLTPRRRPEPSSSGPAPSSSSSRPARRQRPAGPKKREEAKANAEQWRQWAEAAAEALTRRA